MSITQSVAGFILPATWFSRIRESSERWVIQCKKCDEERSVWCCGGIRFGAASKGKRVAAHCSTCGGIVTARLYHRASSYDGSSSKECE